MWWLVAYLLLLIGFSLLLIELFLIPGFGITGVTGIIVILVGIYVSFAKYKSDLAILILLGSIATEAVIVKLALKTRLAKEFVLETMEKSTIGFRATAKNLERYLGKEGITITPLRPAGTALIEGERIDVITESIFLEKNTPIKVVMVKGNSLVVEKAS